MSWTDDLPEAAHILRRLIDAASPNPPGDCEDVCRVCVEMLAPVVPDVRVVRAPDGTPNVLASLGHGEKTLLIHSHYDTQPAGDLARWTGDPYTATLRDGAIYGRGAGDDKGSVAAQMAALLTLARGEFAPPFRLLFAFVADEESGGQRGTRFLREAGELRADAALIGEQTDNHVATGERGIVWIRVELAGRAAHGAIPEAGNSALIPAAEFIGRLHRELTPRLRRRHPTPILPASSINIGRCLAGDHVSTVPGSAFVEIDRRIVPGEEAESCVREIQVILDAVLDQAPGVTAKIGTFLQSTAFLTSPDNSLVQSLQRAVAETDGPKPLIGYRQSSDARFFAADGIPLVIFGPSDPEVGHAFDEHVRVEDLRRATGILIAFARKVRLPA
jgi:acetylornithine deacetylase/succinyl-diaminopimelate desuccinylase